MSYLLDTCTISEMVAKKPNPKVIGWFENQPDETMYLSIITSGEIQRGIYQLAIGKRKLRLETWLFDVLLPTFEGRIVNVDGKLITGWAKMVAELKENGFTRSSFDSLIEATALQHNFILVTRNEKDFRGSKASILNPWTLDI